MKVKVLITFTDAEAKKIRPEGEIIDLSEERFAEIMSINENLIEETEDTTEYPNHIGGGVYELSDGNKVRGKDEALNAEEALKQTTGDPANTENK